MIVPLFGSGIASTSRVVNAQRRVNVLYDFAPDGDKTPFSIVGTPGLTAMLTLPGNVPVRGWVTDGLRWFIVQGSTLWEVDVALNVTNRGTLLTTAGRVSMATNGVQIMLVDGTAGYILTLATNVFAQIADADFPANPATVTFQEGFFVVSFREDTGTRSRLYVNENAYDGTTWSALDFRNAESNPDGIVRVIADGGEIKVLGERTIESWGYTGDADFPFGPVRGATAEVGCVARWSVAKFLPGICFVGRSRLGGLQVFQMTGYDVQVISTPDLEYELAQYATVADAVGYAYLLDAKPLYVISFPTAGKTWLYDGLASQQAQQRVWCELKSAGGRHFSDQAILFAGRTYVSDYRDGTIYRVDPMVYADNGFPQEREIRTKHFFKDYEFVTVDSAHVDFEVGVGLDQGQGSDPLVVMAVSRDGGQTYGNDMDAPLGRQGEYRRVVEWRRLGTARDFVFRLRMTDPVKFVLTGMAIKATAHG